MTDESMDMDMALASLRADGGDLRALLNVLAAQLQESLGQRLEVEHAGSFLHKSADVRKLRISLGDDEFEADSSGGDVQCTVGHRSGGIRIRSERVAGDVWLTRLTESLKTEAERSESLRRALETMVIGGSS